jgi:hypothetical protein
LAALFELVATASFFMPCVRELEICEKPIGQARFRGYPLGNSEDRRICGLRLLPFGMENRRSKRVLIISENSKEE